MPENKLPTLISSSSSNLFRAAENFQELAKNRVISLGPPLRSQSPLARMDTRNFSNAFEETKATSEEKSSKDLIKIEIPNQGTNEQKHHAHRRRSSRLKTHSPMELASGLLYDHPVRKSLSVFPSENNTETRPNLNSQNSSPDPFSKITLKQQTTTSDSLQLPTKFTIQTQSKFCLLADQVTPLFLIIQEPILPMERTHQKER